MATNEERQARWEAIQERMQDVYNKTMDDAYLKFHVHSTHLRYCGEHDPSDDAVARRGPAEYDGNGKLVGHSHKVVVHGTPGYSNGLPVKHR